MRPIAFLLLAAAANAQSPVSPSFEVATVKIDLEFRQDDRSTWQPRNEISPGSLRMRHVTLLFALGWAHRQQRPLISGPAWLDTERYDIQGKAAGPVSEDALRPMLASLLAERFRIALHRESRQMSVLALVLPKGGHKMTASLPDTKPGPTELPGGAKLIRGAPLAEFAYEMSGEAGLPVLDMTGLEGRFDFTLNPQKYMAELRARVMADPQHAPPEAELHVALLQDLVAGDMGLRLERRKGQVEMLVIDRAERVPAGN
jgi:uncharacterized protein (TIGR03435 family)